MNFETLVLEKVEFRISFKNPLFLIDPAIK